ELSAVAALQFRESGYRAVFHSKLDLESFVFDSAKAGLADRSESERTPQLTDQLTILDLKVDLHLGAAAAALVPPRVARERFGVHHVISRRRGCSTDAHAQIRPLRILVQNIWRKRATRQSSLDHARTQC